MLRRFPSDRIVLTGGVALDRAIAKFQERKGVTVIVPENTQHNGAIGCAMIDQAGKG